MYSIINIIILFHLPRQFYLNSFQSLILPNCSCYFIRIFSFLPIFSTNFHRILYITCILLPFQSNFQRFNFQIFSNCPCYFSIFHLCLPANILYMCTVLYNSRCLQKRITSIIYFWSALWY